jgi:cytochrome bd-type quinol oxidase subunit 2
LKGQTLARGALLVSGTLLLAVGIIHLAMTGHLSHWMSQEMSPDQAALLVPPSVLNHVVVGILFLPLGGGTIIAVSALRDGAPWAWRLLLLNALSVLLLPLTILAVMDVSRYASWPFWTAVALVFLIPVIMLACVYLLRPRNK